MRSVPTARLTTGRGIVGDRYENTRHRHVSVFATGELDAASAQLGVEIDPALTRRNVLVQADRLQPAIGDELLLGDARLQVVRGAHPCKLLDDLIGDGAKTALRRRGGVICRVLHGGDIAVGALLQAVPSGND